MKTKVFKAVTALTFLFAFGSQVQAKISSPEQYMDERTKISNKTNSVRDRMQTITKNPNSATPRDIRVMCNDAPKAINQLTQLNLDAMKLFPTEAQKVLKDENVRNVQFVKKLNSDCTKLKQQFKVQ
jgi:hypothetical protein